MHEPSQRIEQAVVQTLIILGNLLKLYGKYQVFHIRMKFEKSVILESYMVLFLRFFEQNSLYDLFIVLFFLQIFWHTVSVST